MGLLTLTAAGDRLGLSTGRLRQLIALGRLRAQMVGKTYVITERELERFMALKRPSGRPKTEADRLRHLTGFGPSMSILNRRHSQVESLTLR